MIWRFRVILLIFFGLFLLILLRLAEWQIAKAETLARLGESQYGRFIKLTPQRGEIKTSDGYAIVANKLSYLIFANPKEVKEKDKTAKLLSPTLEIDEASISAVLDLNRFWVAIKHYTDVEKKEELEKMELAGVGFEEQYVRFYPEASVAAQMLGFVGKSQDGSDLGYFGIEGFYDRQLRGKEGLARQIHDALGRPILAKMRQTSGQIDGRSLTLYVDRAVQFLLEEELKKGMKIYGALRAMGVVMDPKTGAILAMASFPTFDPRSYADFEDTLYKNPLITDTYEPGSTFKPLVMAAAIEENLVKPDTICVICDGPVAIGGYEIRTWNNKYYPNSTMIEVIQHSDNTGMVFVGQKLGLERMLTYFEKFGIGELTGIDLQGETTSIVRPSESWYSVDLATASFGQGVTVTPIELLSAFSAIANDGKRMEPHVVKEIETPEGEVIPLKPRLINQPISKKTAKIMTEILVNAVDNGEAKWAKPKGYRIAGKTGTAQIPIEGHYDPNKTIPSFIGFAPADDPKFLILIVLDRPTTSIYGSETAAPIFFNIAKKLFTYYSIPPTE